VADDPGAEPLQALLLGPIRVAPKEIPTLRTRLVDVDRLAQEGPLEPALLDQLVAEIATPSDEVVVAYRGGTRYVEGFERIPPLRDSPGSGLRDGGVYLVTGGLGGLGLVAAHAIASKVRPRLALVGRTGLPPAEERSRWLAEHSAHDKISRAIREIAALEAAGAEVLVLSGDVADPAQTKSLVERVRARFGRVDGVIHAAGVLDDGPLLGRDRERSESVLAAKVYGTFALDEALAGESLDFFVVFSSISAVLGVPGQTDYTAANAFLDAFARERSRRRAGGRTLSLAWGAWRDVGMAAELAGAARYGEVLGTGAERVRPFEHPLFDARVDGAAGTTAFRTEFRLGRHWMLDEHRVRGGSWVMPGSGYVELLHAALREEGVSDGCVVRDLVFLKPFTVAENESRDLEVRLAKREGGLDVVVRGRKAGTRAWTEHARAQVDLDVREGPTVAPFASVAGRFGVEPSPPEPPHPFMDFGPRWSSLAARRSVDSEALLELALPEPFRGGVAEHVLHPALLDVATGGAQHLIPGRDAARDFYVPVGYGSIRAYAPLGHALHSHVRLREADPESGLASFDVTVYDPDGRALVQIEEFSMIRMHEGASLDADGSEEPEWLRSAITPEEGAEVLLRLFGSATDAHVLVTPRPLEEVAAEVGRQGSSGGSSTGSRRRTSPKIDVGPVERALAEHEAVAEAAALAAADRGGAVRVVAFVTFAPGRHATVSELRRFVRGRVDAALVPQNFVELPSLPRGPDGALDRSALRDPFADVDDFVAPRTPIEEAIAAIWKDLLGLDRVSVHDNFLDVGGHSLVGIRALRRMEEATGVKLHANALTLQTLGQLAADIEKAGGSVAASAAAVSAAEGGPSPAAAEPAREARDGGGFLSRIRKVLVRG
jgi:NAD(P)-dependent dehydrogenase (short-subunit alcohol dehydrogenase family)